MKTTNYSTIAANYDNNQFRIDELKLDYDLMDYVEQHTQNNIEMLDLSCGTGLYLEKQIQLFKGKNINWYGLDASKEMLNKAKEKVEDVNLVHGYVEKLPYNSGVFDFISNNYAFHHYEDKEKALDEITRVLKVNGIYKLHNIAIHDMPKWWVYYYFPSAYEEDIKRFWKKELVYQKLIERGFKVNLKMEYRMEEIAVKDYFHHAENRDISVLTLISDKDYEDGLMRMKRDLQLDPSKKITNDFAEVFCVSKKV